MAALLYPFEWQHTFITVLPSMLIDVVDAPTPYIVGILASMKQLLDDHCLTEVLRTASKLSEFYRVVSWSVKPLAVHIQQKSRIV